MRYQPERIPITEGLKRGEEFYKLMDGRRSVRMFSDEPVPKEVIETALANNYTTILIADHGNCETMINEDGSPNTAHTTNPVPIILIDKDLKSIKSGVLGDIAPTILYLMGIEKPDEMTQCSLI